MKMNITIEGKSGSGKTFLVERTKEMIQGIIDDKDNPIGQLFASTEFVFNTIISHDDEGLEAAREYEREKLTDEIAREIFPTCIKNVLDNGRKDRNWLSPQEMQDASIDMAFGFASRMAETLLIK